MIREHEIPNGSKLYFQKSAKLKREIENKSAELLEKLGYEEIVTTFFSYHQERSYDKNVLIKLSDINNNTLYLRADSTVDVVRLITKRLGRSISQQKWFYIQPVFTYPSNEIYQIGCEHINNNDLSITLKDCIQVLNTIEIKPLLQISNIKIPKIISGLTGIDLEVFKSSNLERIFSLNLKWLDKLAYLQNVEEIEEIINIVPSEIELELNKILKLSKSIDYENMVIAPLFFAQMNYYDGIFFRFIENNSILGMGGCYNYKDIKATGFALYTDKIIEEKL